MKKPTEVISLTCLLLSIPAGWCADRAHDLAKLAAKQKAVTGCNPASLNTRTCHTQFPTGCTDSANRYDACLNFLKDQVHGPALASPTALIGNDFQLLEGKIPKGLGSSNHAKSAPALAGLGEGNIVTVIAYLYFVEDTSKGNSKPSIGEIANCKLQLPDSYDYHIGMGFDPALARQILKNKPRPVIDNVHLNVNDDCSFPGATASCWRSTVWEVHPVTQFYVCSLKNKLCDQSSPDSAWTSLDNVP